MNELTYRKALELDLRIKAAAQSAQQSLYDMCVALKEMRDGKQYRELGFENFEAYTEQEIGIKRRHAYRLISIAENLSSDFVPSMTQIGTTKLYLLSTLTDAERETVTADMDIDNVTVRQLQDEITALHKAQSDLNAENQQLRRDRVEAMNRADTAERTVEAVRSESQKQVAEAKAAQEKTRDTLKGIINKQHDKMQQMQEQIAAAESRPVEVAVDEQAQQQLAAAHEKIASLERRLAEKPDTQMPLGVQPIYQPDRRGEFQALMRVMNDAHSHMIAFLSKEEQRGSYDIHEYTKQVDNSVEMFCAALDEIVNPITDEDLKSLQEEEV